MTGNAGNHQVEQVIALSGAGEVRAAGSVLNEGTSPRWRTPSPRL
jgi:hypothetical protein